MIGIGRQTDYAVRIVLHLSCLPAGARVPAVAIARQRRLPAAFVRRIVARLAAADILHTVRGSGGGVSLARPAAEISLLEVVRAMEGGVGLNVCVDAPASCPLAHACPVNRTWTRLTRSLEEQMAAVRFDRLAEPAEHRTAHRLHATAQDPAGRAARRRRVRRP